MSTCNRSGILSRNAKTYITRISTAFLLVTKVMLHLACRFDLHNFSSIVGAANDDTPPKLYFIYNHINFINLINLSHCFHGDKNNRLDIENESSSCTGVIIEF